jgi:hypothetical protein
MYRFQQLHVFLYPADICTCRVATIRVGLSILKLFKIGIYFQIFYVKEIKINCPAQLKSGNGKLTYRTVPVLARKI